uniref:Uncharacterized protein n=1 Tax=Lepeophtheirus salmonis TaxID=72036 RepID=A0A0K2TYT6_LEPSM
MSQVDYEHFQLLQAPGVVLPTVDSVLSAFEDISKAHIRSFRTDVFGQSLFYLTFVEDRIRKKMLDGIQVIIKDLRVPRCFLKYGFGSLDQNLFEPLPTEDERWDEGNLIEGKICFPSDLNKETT